MKFSWFRVGMNLAEAGLTAGLDDTERKILDTIEPVNAPLILISQVQRSGGTLMSQLFDGHSEILAHPHELKIGSPTKSRWPPISPATGARRNFRTLMERDFIRLAKDGYTKGHDRRRPLPMGFELHLQRRLFEKLCREHPPRDERGILDHYFASFFRAWTDYRGAVENAKFVTGFVPQLAFDAENVGKYFAAYPDGWLISVIRDPFTWYPSAKRHIASKSPRRRLRHPFNTIGSALDFWCRSAESIIDNKTKFSGRVLVLTFEDLVGNTEATMRHVAARIGIEFENALATPTFNGWAMTANTSFGIQAQGIVAETLSRDRHLENEERAAIADRCADLHAQVAQLAEMPSPVRDK